MLSSLKPLRGVSPAEVVGQSIVVTQRPAVGAGPRERELLVGFEVLLPDLNGGQ